MTSADMGRLFVLSARLLVLFSLMAQLSLADGTTIGKRHRAQIVKNDRFSAYYTAAH